MQPVNTTCWHSLESYVGTLSASGGNGGTGISERPPKEPKLERDSILMQTIDFLSVPGSWGISTVVRHLASGVPGGWDENVNDRGQLSPPGSITTLLFSWQWGSGLTCSDQ